MASKKLGSVLIEVMGGEDVRIESSAKLVLKLIADFSAPGNS